MTIRNHIHGWLLAGGDEKELFDAFGRIIDEFAVELVSENPILGKPEYESALKAAVECERKVICKFFRMMNDVERSIAFICEENQRRENSVLDDTIPF